MKTQEDAADYRVVYLDSYVMTAHAYVTPNGESRAELCGYLKAYPELHDFIRSHEIRHAKVGAVYRWEHLPIDIKDRVTLFTNPILYRQWQQFRREMEVRKTIKQTLILLVCEILAGFAELTARLVGIPIRMYRRRYKRTSTAFDPI